MPLCVSKKYESGKMNCFIEQLFMDVKEMSYLSLITYSFCLFTFSLIYYFTFVVSHNFFHFQVPIEAAHLYHAVMQYAYALNKTLANNMEPNGMSIINALKGHTFDSK